MDDKTFKLLRRNSLHLECPEGVFDELEREEDGEFEPERITHSECMMLQRVLSDKTKIPRACAMANGNGLVNTGASSTGALQMQPMARVPELVRRMSGGVPGAFDADPTPSRKKELGGPVTMGECQTLSQFLRPSVGGAYLLPSACTAMLRRADDEEREEAERENAKVYQRLKRRMSQVAVEDYPPTFI